MHIFWIILFSISLLWFFLSITKYMEELSEDETDMYKGTIYESIIKAAKDK